MPSFYSVLFVRYFCLSCSFFSCSITFFVRGFRCFSDISAIVNNNDYKYSSAYIRRQICPFCNIGPFLSSFHSMFRRIYDTQGMFLRCNNRFHSLLFVILRYVFCDCDQLNSPKLYIYNMLTHTHRFINLILTSV